MAIAESTANSLTVYAGINSALKDQQGGRNEHFRSFRIGLPSRKRKADGTEKPATEKATEAVKTQALTRVALFSSANGPANDTYQRVLRVSPKHTDGGELLTAIASGLAPKNEVLVMTTKSTPTTKNVISRINLESSEAADLDIAPVEDELKTHVLAYCTDYDVYLQHIPSKSSTGIQEPNKVYSTPTGGRRSKIRSLRWLNSRYLILLRNRPQGTGADLVILKTDKDYTQSQDVLEKKLSKQTKQAVGLTACALSASPTGEQQFLIAVAGQDSSIEILSIDWLPGSGMSRFRQYARLRDAHSGPITRLTFSNFIPPSLPVTKETKPQYIRLASVSVDLHLAVHTLPLRPYPALKNKTPRYVLTPPPETVQNAINILTALFIVGIVAFCMQVFCEIRGVVPPTLHAQSWLSPTWADRLAVPYGFAMVNGGMPGPVIPESMPPVIQSAVDSAFTAVDSATSNLLSHLVDEQQTNTDMALKQILLRDQGDSDDVAAEVHHEDSEALKDEKVKKWDDLSEREKKGWKKRLIDAGHWTEKQGETVLKGILFSELAGAVGAAVRG